MNIYAQYYVEFQNKRTGFKYSLADLNINHFVNLIFFECKMCRFLMFIFFKWCF